MELIAGLTGPTEGEIEFEGRAVQRSVPDVFQEDACFPWLNVHQNVEFGLRQKNIGSGKRAGPLLSSI
jgi:NitT/TauT family transport system ATP-binding protein